MNIQVQCCGVAILVFLLYFVRRHKSVGLLSEQMFLKALVVTMVCLCLDILSIVGIVNHEIVPDWLVKLVCKTYIASLVWVGYSALVYTLTDLYDNNKRKNLHNKYTFVVAAGTVLIYVLPIRYYHQGKDVYTYGLSVQTTYLFAVGFVIVTLYKVMAHGKEMNPKRKNAVRIWMLIWILAAVTQFFCNRLLLVGFASALGMMILFFELENPEARLDRETGIYNSHALLSYMKQLYQREKTFSLLQISFEDYQNAVKQAPGMDVVVKEIIEYLAETTDAKLFKNVGHELMLLFADEKKMYEAFPAIQKRFRGAWNRGSVVSQTVWLEPLFLLLPDNTVAKSAEEIFHLFRYFKYQSNHTEGSTVCYINQTLVDQKREKEELEQKIHAAIEEHRVEVFYQPIYSTKKQKFVSAEALVRIREKDGSIIPPGRFIALAEETGQILQLGEIVFEKTCRFLKQHRLWEYGIEYIEVNLSVRQCEEYNLADMYMDIIKKYDLDPACINLEITETASIQTKQRLVENMKLLIDFGVKFSLDDFGSGESNLNYIVDMPVSIVKFDRDMSQAYFENKRAKFVMEAAMRMIHDMKLKIVSEGVETKEQMETIVGMGIDYIQGFYFSKPLPQKDFLDFVQRENGRCS